MNLRQALEASVLTPEQTDGPVETELEDEPIVNAVGIQFITQSPAMGFQQSGVAGPVIDRYPTRRQLT